MPYPPIEGGGGWPLLDGQRYEAAGLTASTEGTLLTASGTAHTKGSYAQLIASTAFDAQGIYVAVLNSGSSSALWLIDIAIGAAASEQVIIPNLLVQQSSIGPIGAWVFVPIQIPAGSRLSARVQSDVSSGLIRIVCHLQGGGFAHPSGLSRVTAYGPDTATTRGVAVDPGGTVHTKGSYAQVVASTTNPIRAIIVAAGHQKQTSGADVRRFVDIAVGAGGSEQVVIPDLIMWTLDAFDEFKPTYLGPFPISIPAGTRLAVRAQASSTDAADRDFDVALYGLD